jgi:hypothetical protein
LAIDMIESRRARKKSRQASTDASGLGALLESVIAPAQSLTVTVLVERLRRRTLTALGYGASLHPRSLSGVHVGVDPHAAAKLTREWDRQCPELILELLEPPSGSVAAAIRELALTEVATGSTFVIIVPERENSLRAAFGLAEPSVEIVEALHDVPNAWAILLPV